VVDIGVPNEAYAALGIEFPADAHDVIRR
jgi:hypothetical protein